MHCPAKMDFFRILAHCAVSVSNTNYKKNNFYPGVNHPKLKAFQKAVEATLKKRLQQAKEELDFFTKRKRRQETRPSPTNHSFA